MLCKLKIGRTQTINAKNYEMIKPNVELEVSDIPVEEVSSVYFQMNDIVTHLFQIEQAELYADLVEIRDKGLVEHIKSIIKQDFDVIKNNIDTALNKITSKIEKQNSSYEMPPKFK